MPARTSARNARKMVPTPPEPAENVVKNTKTRASKAAGTRSEAPPATKKTQPKPTQHTASTRSRPPPRKAVAYPEEDSGSDRSEPDREGQGTLTTAKNARGLRRKVVEAVAPAPAPKPAPKPATGRRKMVHYDGSDEDEKEEEVAPKPVSKARKAGKRKPVSFEEDEEDEEDEAVYEAVSEPRKSKRKRDEEDADEDLDEQPKKAKKPRSNQSKTIASKGASSVKSAPRKSAPRKTPKAPKAPKTPKTPKIVQRKPGDIPRPRVGARGIINVVPDKQFDVFVFGEGSSGELGLGSTRYDGGKKPIDVKRPRINHNLKGVVAIACGGMHCIALTHDQTVLTWGVNDDKALGRDTHWEGGVRDIDDDEDDDDNDTGINPRESTPGAVDLSILGEETKVVQVAATDSASFIVTDDGLVYGWGTFRGAEGILGFNAEVKVQPTPVLINGLSKVISLACGSNHVLAVDLDGRVVAWGSGGQYQLGRKVLAGRPGAGLTPQACGRFSSHHAVSVGAGSYHSFYIDDSGRVWSWGLNNYAQTGLEENRGKDDAMVLRAQPVKSLDGLRVKQITGGEHHTVAVTKDGRVLTWGRVDGHQVGQPSSIFTEENSISDDNGTPRILTQPTALEGIEGAFVAVGTDTSFVIDKKGKVYSWGFSANYQTGLGTTDEIEVPTLIDNSAIRDRKIVWVGAGGQFSVLAAEAQAETQVAAEPKTATGAQAPVEAEAEAGAEVEASPATGGVESEAPVAAAAQVEVEYQVKATVEVEAEDVPMVDAA